MTRRKWFRITKHIKKLYLKLEKVKKKYNLCIDKLFEEQSESSDKEFNGKED